MEENFKTVIQSSEAQVGHGGSGSILESPILWMWVSFILFFLVLGKTFKNALLKILDSEVSRVNKNINDVIQVRADAESLLLKVEQGLANAEIESKNLVTNAQLNAEAMKEKYQEQTRQYFLKYEKQLDIMLSLMESKMVRELKEELAQEIIIILSNDAKQLNAQQQVELVKRWLDK